MDSKDVGNLGEHLAIVELLKNNVIVSRPLGDSAKYDLVLDVNGVLLKAQVKSTLSGCLDYVEFWLYTSSERSKSRDLYYTDIDLFILVDLQKNKVFALESTGSDKTVRFRYSGGNCLSKKAEDYYLEKYLSTLP